MNKMEKAVLNQKNLLLNQLESKLDDASTKIEKLENDLHKLGKLQKRTHIQLSLALDYLEKTLKSEPYLIRELVRND